jgi:hypothetical protein
MRFFGPALEDCQLAIALYDNAGQARNVVKQLVVGRLDMTPNRQEGFTRSLELARSSRSSRASYLPFLREG